ncbi:DUF1835 domain-containing protein [Paraburkholderia bonniea]|uniref:DUF1835 domain-containing protein n=1 Tax=Paraburkholderia bonniea TaxID=2152891 RepID=UPI001292242C|nr:DUF1835 domain-containing protein [Paraburkholderia bonniea]WJF90527.1 DUF1835 domain-containing protein [Paraburkholderia bonniea]WJF93842.1 DUF1835 domain-containing protein [Paraburkholderia bonniea]
MSTIHITNGDVAAQALRDALHLANRNEIVKALRDDLAVGPLNGIDGPTSLRAEFWQHVLGNTAPNLSDAFNEQALMLEELASGTASVVIWHGQSTGDQLTLRRICYHLRNSPQRLNEVRLSASDLPAHTRQRRADQATSVGMFERDELRDHLGEAAPISVLRISRLALEWQEAKQANGETRRWRHNTFTSGGFAELDAFILGHVSSTWQRAALVVEQLMAADVGFLVSDSVAFWRLQELAAYGRIQLRGAPHLRQTLELSAATSAAARSN